MKEHLLTHKIIAGCIAGTDSGKQNHKIVSILGIVALVLGVIGLVFPVITLICWGFAALCFILRNKSMRIIKSILNKEYSLREDICINKRLSTSTDGPDSKYLIFEKMGQVEANFPYAIWNSEAFTRTPDLYKSTEIGDGVYLLCTPEGRVLFAFNKRFWKLNADEFLQTDELFVPVKDFTNN